MPAHTRAAMLDGVRANEIVAGAYSDRNGGVCPMLAAHRCGGRTDYIAFARAWDRFTDTVSKHRRARRATRRETRILISQLEASLLAEQQLMDLGEAISDHRDLRARAKAAAVSATRERPGDRDRSRELRGVLGWRWTRPARRLEDYERALAWAEREQTDAARAPQPEFV
ncbi:MAG: hypothetical protein ACR2ND_10650 [Solirubrobacteraceae bacterium]